MRRFFQDLHAAAFTAGFVAVLVGFTSSVAIVFQAAQAFNATPAQQASWIWALSVGMGLCTLVPSLWLKKPVMVAWSTPGAAVLATAGIAGGFSLGEAVGAFMVCAVLVTLAGVTGWFEKTMSRMPVALASALLAGVLTNFGLQAFAAAQTALPLVLVMLVTYLLCKRLMPLYAVVLTLAVGVMAAAWQGQMGWQALRFAWTTPAFVVPVFTWAAAVNLAIPLFVVTMASQNLPGIAAIRAAGYGEDSEGGGIPISKVITLTGLTTLVLAPFGAFAISLSAISAAICMGPEAHEDPRKRYTAAASCGALYVLMGFGGVAVISVLTAFPKALVVAIAGLALLGTIGTGLASAVKDEQHREAALITFLVTLSGVTLVGIGSAFWGVVAGALALAVQQYGRPGTSAQKVAPPDKATNDQKSPMPGSTRHL